MDLFLFVLVSFLLWTKLYIACQVKSLDSSNLSRDKTLDYVAHTEMSASKITLKKINECGNSGEWFPNTGNIMIAKGIEA